MAVSELTCIYFALNLQENEVMVLSNVNIESLICNEGVGGPAPAAGGAAPARGAVPATTSAPGEEEKEQANEEKSEESDDDMDFGLFN
ncbi:60S acidic ribosomal protein P1-like [Dromiciops gliroides]|uniref:60S acidic ribosomal protein P1-like n=1 Tax=Dromiciops gliroides TaxID=33562 RepID=UPI001CC4BCDD|nr:60S acidic ribosomal protein P1-like [Dromiciops gliroides]